MIRSKYLVVTNNPLVKEKYENFLNIMFFPSSKINVLSSVRTLVLKGYQALNDPSSSCFEIRDNPFSTVVLSNEKNNNVDLISLGLIEKMINLWQFRNGQGNPGDKAMHDFQLLEMSRVEICIIQTCLNDYSH